MSFGSTMGTQRSRSTLAFGLLLAGSAALAVGLLRNPGALHMQAGMDGCFMVGLVAFALTLLGGLPYRTALLVMAPIAFIQAIGCRTYDVSPFAILGLEAAIVGTAGLALDLLTRAARPAAASTATSAVVSVERRRPERASRPVRIAA